MCLNQLTHARRTHTQFHPKYPAATSATRRALATPYSTGCANGRPGNRVTLAQRAQGNEDRVGTCIPAYEEEGLSLHRHPSPQPVERANDFPCMHYMHVCVRVCALARAPEALARASKGCAQALARSTSMAQMPLLRPVGAAEGGDERAGEASREVRLNPKS